MSRELKTKVLYYGDNLPILREHIPDESVDLIYLDPPFNSKRTYNVLFRERTGASSEAQIEAFEDSWHWGDAARLAYDDVMMGSSQRVARLLRAIVDGIGSNDITAYLVMMTVRLIELHRVLKSTGSLYLHCDPVAGPYLRLILDAIFGPASFRNEIIWKRTSAHNDPKKYGANIDVIWYYVKSEVFTFNRVHIKHTDEYLSRFRKFDESGKPWQDYDLTAKGLTGGGYEYEYRGVKSLWRVPLSTMERLDEEGRLHFTRAGGIRLKRYLEDTKGVVLQALWTDIPPINSQAKEKLPFQTQKPQALLERIIQVSSNPGDIVLDPFCGCGTAVHAAEFLGRRWLGIDITYLAINLIERRIKDAFPELHLEIIGHPTDLPGAQKLAQDDKWQFQLWAITQIDGQPVSGRKPKKGADRGIDGVIPIFLGPTVEYGNAIISVKGGENIGVSDVRDLRGVIERENSNFGVLVVLNKPTRPMLVEAAQAGTYHSELWGKSYPRIQILQVEEILQGKKPELPGRISPFTKMPYQHRKIDQLKLGGD
jgi:site-specific DNA-methyltransferase (adenine-specific)